MADINWNDISIENKNRIQGYVAGITTRGNPDLASTGAPSSRLALDPSLLGEDTPAKGILTLAINEVLRTASSASVGTNNFDERFSKILGNEVENTEDWEALQLIAENITKAILKLNTDVQDVEFGTLTIDELEASHVQQYVLNCKFWTDLEHTTVFPDGKFKVNNRETWENSEVTLNTGTYIISFIDVEGYTTPADQEVILDSSTTLDIVYETA